MPERTLLEEMSDEVILKAMEHAAARLVGDATRWGGFSSELQGIVRKRALEIMNTDPDINAAIKRGLIEGIESWKAPRR